MHVILDKKNGHAHFVPRRTSTCRMDDKMTSWSRWLRKCQFGNNACLSDKFSPYKTQGKYHKEEMTGTLLTKCRKSSQEKTPKSWVDERICLIWSRGRQFSLHLPNLGRRRVGGGGSSFPAAISSQVTKINRRLRKLSSETVVFNLHAL